MQQNRRYRIEEAETGKEHTAFGSAAKEESFGFVPPAAVVPQQVPEALHAASESSAAPRLQMPIGYVVQTAQPAKGLGAGEKQALAGGFFVMFSLAIAVAIGWWITPATPSSLTANDIQVRSEPPASMAPGRNGARAAVGGGAATSPALAGGEREAVGEILMLPETAELIDPAATPIAAASSLAKSAQGKPAASGPESGAPASATDSSGPNVTSGKSSKSGMSAAEREEEKLRLKAKAYSESRADRRAASPAAKSTSAPKPGSSSSSRSRAAQPARADLSKAVAECSKEVGLFFQERCKWRLCNGRWGKQGCPSYDTEPHASRQAGIVNDNDQQPAPNKKARQISLSRFGMFS